MKYIARIGEGFLSQGSVNISPGKSRYLYNPSGEGELPLRFDSKEEAQEALLDHLNAWPSRLRGGASVERYDPEDFLPQVLQKIANGIEDGATICFEALSQAVRVALSRRIREGGST